ncbi:MAG: peptide chain release factor N(5)-glutamine methyltransferase [Actinomycetota bacterium]
MPSVKKVLDEAEAQLKQSDAIEHPHAGKERYDAEELLAFVLGRDQDDLDHLQDVDERFVRKFRQLLARRARGEPNAYITQRTRFAGLTLDVGPGAFIPRESSEFMVEQAARRLRTRREPFHVDLATGVGPVALAVAKEVPQAKVFGIDISDRPIVMARWNARRLGINNVHFVKGDLFAPLSSDLQRRVDVVTIHPPYVRRGELRTLPDEIRKFEPLDSLTDHSKTGIKLLERVTEEAPGWLRRGGWLLVEVSPDRSRQVATVLRHGGFKDVRSTRGGVGVTRVVVGHT